ncbi:hypothetical protein EDC04DRAFT_2603838 [Pisolithus marmoratus]|nr:hypothetical protein EDC04DRAFT_2603838 [Pisolithus marmoratus]
MGTYAATGPMYNMVMQDAKKGAIEAINSAYGLVHNPLKQDIMQASKTYYGIDGGTDKEKVALCVMVTPTKQQQSCIKQLFKKNRAEGQSEDDSSQRHSSTDDEVVKMLEKTTLEQLAELKKAKEQFSKSEKISLECHSQLEDRVTTLTEDLAMTQQSLKKTTKELLQMKRELKTTTKELSEAKTWVLLNNTVNKLFECTVHSLTGDIPKTESVLTSTTEELLRTKMELGKSNKDLVSRIFQRNKLVGACSSGPVKRKLATALLVPIHLCTLLDLAQRKVIGLLGHKSMGKAPIVQ